ncbi:MAG: YbgC/FadM family acyl-CoA thioesterase [Endomicrobiia bacterium]
MKHTLKTKIYYEDTDAGGVVYYANYLRYFERARTELLESCEIKISEFAKEGFNFVVVKAEIDYISAAKLGDVLEIQTKLIELKKASLTFEYNVIRESDKKIIAKGITKLACVDKNFRPTKIPEEIQLKLLTYKE